MKKYYVKEDLLISVAVNKSNVEIDMPIEGMVEIKKIEYMTHHMEIKFHELKNKKDRLKIKSKKVMEVLKE